MTFGVRANVVSSFTAVKGAMIPETYEVLAQWDFELTKKANLDRLREQNYIGAHSANWLRDVAKVLNRRLDPDGRDRALVVLAKGAESRAQGIAVDDAGNVYVCGRARDSKGYPHSLARRKAPGTARQTRASTPALARPREARLDGARRAAIRRACAWKRVRPGRRSS